MSAVRDLEDVQLDAYLLAVDHPVGAVFERVRRRDRAGFVLDGVAGGALFVQVPVDELDGLIEPARRFGAPHLTIAARPDPLFDDVPGDWFGGSGCWR